jgi:hypothetical protein
MNQGKTKLPNAPSNTAFSLKVPRVVRINRRLMAVTLRFLLFFLRGHVRRTMQRVYLAEKVLLLSI